MAFVLVEVLGLILLIKNGTLLKSAYWKAGRIAVFGIVVGALFKILHFPGAALISGISYPALGMVYVVWFFFKKSKHLLDVLKLVWVVTHFFPFLADFEYSFVIEIVRHLALLGAVFLFIRKRFSTGSPSL